MPSTGKVNQMSDVREVGIVYIPQSVFAKHLLILHRTNILLPYLKEADKGNLDHGTVHIEMNA